MEIQLSDKQQEAFDLYKSSQNVFVTGPGGTGKTTLIKHIVADAKSNRRNVQVCALTGTAAVLLNCNAKTLHAWGGFGLANGPATNVVSRIYADKRRHYNWKKVHLLIVDEISMMSAKLLEILDLAARKIRNNSNPFGGIQVLFFGDFYQLSPVGSPDEPESSQFAFEYELWDQLFPHYVCLDAVFRQNDEKHVKMLNNIRKGKLTKSSYALLSNRVGVELDIPFGLTPTKLLPLRRMVDSINSSHMSQLESDEVMSDVETVPDLSLMKDSKNHSQMVMEQDYLLKNTPCEKKLVLKVGAQVMCVVNLDLESATPICNGSQGMVIGFEGNRPIVKFTNGRVMTMDKHSWVSERFETVSIKQYPLILAWAMTIHKAQGATLDYAEIDAGSGIFACGQTYVALSRVRSIEGLSLTSFDPSKIKIDQRVKDFYERLESLQ